jgi:predicted permease
VRRVFRIPFSRFRLVREVDDEILFHLQTRIDALVAAGMSPEDARAAALKQFGDVHGVRGDMLVLDRERETAGRRRRIAGEIRQDVAYGIRTLRRNAALAGLVIGGLALGIGANAAIYSLIDAVLVRSLPVKNPEGLIVVGDPHYVDSRGHGTPNGLMYSYPLFLDVRKNATAFDGLAAVGSAERVDAYFGELATELEHPHGRLVSGNYFAVLGVRAAAGRTLDARADDPSGPAEATISDEYWTRRFHRDPSVVGRDVRIDGIRVTITGVAQPGFTGEVVGERTDIWLPVGIRDRLHPNNAILSDRRMMWLLLIGRAKAGLTLAQVRAATSPVVESAIRTAAKPDELSEIKERGFTFAYASGARGLSSVRDTFGNPLVALMLGVALLLAIVCVNVANLLLARGVARRREMSLRIAIGANRARIVRQLLTESLLLALFSGAAALLVAWWGSRALVALASEGSPISVSLGPTPRVLAFTFALSIVSVLFFGLAPALRASRVDLAATLRSTGRSVTHGARFGALLISAQVALSLVLLAGASILTRSLQRTESIPLGFDRDHLIVGELDVATPGYADARLANAVHSLRDHIAAIPGVSAVSYSENGIFNGTEWHTDIHVAGHAPHTPKDSVTAADEVGAGYAAALGARLIAGRDLAAGDESVAPHTALVNASFAKLFFPNGNAVGRIARFDDSSMVQIVGVIADVRGQSLDTTGVPGAARRIYIPYLHQSGTTKFGQPKELRLLVRTTGDPSALVQVVRRAITETDRSIAIDDLEPVTGLIRLSIRDERLVARLATGLGALALLLAAIGLFGVTSYSIARRTSEIGVRIALGARRADIARLVMRDGLRPVAVGIVIGLPLAIGAARILEHHLNDISSDPASLAVAVAVLVASAIAAVLLPARRAMLIDPIGALREE